MHVLAFIHIGVTLAANSNGYAPVDVQCPSQISLRRTNGALSSEENAWLQNRDSKTQSEIINWLEASNLEGIDVRSYLSNKWGQNGVNSIRIGMGFSGGGFRAMLSGAGQLAALDKNTPGSMKKGGLGGLLQASTYVSGLSGGSWLIGSLAMNNWTSVPHLQSHKQLWEFQSPFDPKEGGRRGIMGMFQPSWATSVVIDVSKKQDSGYPISMTDVWGRLLSAQLFPGSDHGSSLLWSDLTGYDQITSATMPLPIIVCDSSNSSLAVPQVGNGEMTVKASNKKSKEPATPWKAYTGISLNSSLIEITPFEFGSWDPTINSFIETKYLGSSLGSSDMDYLYCSTGMDNVGFLIGSSSTLFNAFIPAIFNAGPLKNIYNSILNAYNGIQNIMYALIGPNPFLGASWVVPSVSGSTTLKLADGGEDGQNIPLAPLIRPERNLDLVFAFDNSADTSDNWPNGMSIYQTYLRQNSIQGNNVSFPLVPTPDTMLKYKLNTRPVFFGCNVKNSDHSQQVYKGPVIAYIPNNLKSYSANQKTFKLSYTNQERDDTITNGYNVMTMNNGTADAEWRQCLACAVLLRTQQRNGDTPTEQCGKCFDRYCYA